MLAVEKSDYRRYVFVGNREYVLREMIDRKFNIAAVWVMDGSFLQKRLEAENFIGYDVIHEKKELLDKINGVDFDILISNGNKYVLPISSLKKALYINIHPSFLPDLKGKNPVNGACLLGRSAGAACHWMDDGIDTGKVISRVEIPMTEDIEAAILYQLSFKAEVLVFREAYRKNFMPAVPQPQMDGAVYYTMRLEESMVDFRKGFDHILRQTKAFGDKSHGVCFSCNGKTFTFYRSSEVTNAFVTKLYKDSGELRILLAFDDSIVFKVDGRFMRFDGIVGRNILQEGDLVENGII